MDKFSGSQKHNSTLSVNGATAAVLVVDMLNDFCSEGGLMVLPQAQLLYSRQQTVLDAARGSGAVVVYVNDSHRHNMRVEREFEKRLPHCWDDSWGGSVVNELAPKDQDIIVIKRRYSGFFQTDLDLTLRDMKIDTLIVMGVVTNICVRSTVHDAFFLGYNVAVPIDCVAATSAREQESSLYDIGTHFGWVTKSEQVVSALAQHTNITNIVGE